MIKNLISGGFVASHLADLLLEKGEEVYVYCRWTDDKSSFNHIKDKVTFVPMDLNDYGSCLKTIKEIKPDFIYHLGAQSSVPESFSYPIVTLQTNICGTYNLLEAIKNIRDESENYDPIVHVCSSSEVYGVVPEELQPIKEDCPFNPANPYAVSKVGEDQVALMFWTNYKLKIIRTRFFTHTGPRRIMLSAECFYAKRIAELEKINKEELQKYDLGINYTPNDYIIKLGNMESIRTFADVRDAVKAYYLLARSKRYGEVFNVGGNAVKSIQEVLDYLLSISSLNKDNIKMEVDPKLLRPYDVKKQIVDITKLKNTIDWEPTIPFEQTMSDVLDFWRQNV